MVELINHFKRINADITKEKDKEHNIRDNTEVFAEGVFTLLSKKHNESCSVISGNISSADFIEPNLFQKVNVSIQCCTMNTTICETKVIKKGFIWDGKS